MRCDTLIKDGKVVFPKVGIQDLDIAITNGKVASLQGRGIEVQAGTTIDASGRYVLPGVIDPHVHWGHSGSIAAEAPGESRAAAIGGCTTIIQFSSGGGFFEKRVGLATPTSASKSEERPVLGEDLGFNWCRDLVEKSSYIDVAFHFHIVNEALTARFDRFIRDQGISSFKFIMAYKNRPGFFNEFKDGWFYEALQALAKYGKAVACIHAENDEVCEHFGQKVMKARKQGLAA